MTPWDRSLALETARAFLILFALAAAVAAATDEAFSTLAMRLARLAAFTPALAAIAVALVIARARDRGETRALETLGVSPLRVSLGAEAAAIAIGLVMLTIAVAFGDPSALFPRLTTHGSFVSDGADLVDLMRGLRVSPDGAIALLPSDGSGGPRSIDVASPAAAAFAIGPLAVLAPIWVAAPSGIVSRAAAGAATLVLAIVAFHWVAVGRAPAVSLVLSGAPLLAHLLLGLVPRLGRTHAEGR